MKLVWYRRAERDRHDQLAFIGDRNPRAAIAMGDAVEAAISRLIEMHRSGRTGKVSVTRELVVPRTPFVIVYRLHADRIVIVRMLHGAQRWPPRR